MEAGLDRFGQPSLHQLPMAFPEGIGPEELAESHYLLSPRKHDLELA